LTFSSINTDSVRALAGHFRTAADALAQRRLAFRERALLTSEAFGPLPAGRRTQAGYAERLNDMDGSLHRLQETLQQFASNLETTAANWERADQASRVDGA
jgi:uncharacterized protein YukE